MSIFIPIWVIYVLLLFPCVAILVVCAWIIGIFVFPLLDKCKEYRDGLRWELEYLFFTWYRQAKKTKKARGRSLLVARVVPPQMGV